MPRTPARATRTASVDPISREHDGTVQSLLRAMALLEILSEDDEGYRFSGCAGVKRGPFLRASRSSFESLGVPSHVDPMMSA